MTKEKKRKGELSGNYYEEARSHVPPNLHSWLMNPAIESLSPNLKPAIRDAVSAKNWDGLVNAFARLQT